MTPAITTVGIRDRAEYDSNDIESTLGAGGIQVLAETRLYIAWSSDAAASFQVEFLTEDGASWVEAEDIAGQNIRASANSTPVMPPQWLNSGGARLRIRNTSGVGIDYAISYTELVSAY
ncbi:unnamed protein product [marine sediment metagenome]|uniref:Uncharacterized protein n=1 Tax=marine sediment metagenome TaxID=412755 RepID=X1A6V4_9ZZZZ